MGSTPPDFGNPLEKAKAHGLAVGQRLAAEQAASSHALGQSPLRNTDTLYLDVHTNLKGAEGALKTLAEKFARVVGGGGYVDIARQKKRERREFSDRRVTSVPANENRTQNYGRRAADCFYTAVTGVNARDGVFTIQLTARDGAKLLNGNLYDHLTGDKALGVSGAFSSLTEGFVHSVREHVLKIVQENPEAFPAWVDLDANRQKGLYSPISEFD